LYVKKKRKNDHNRIVFNLKPSLSPFDVGVFILSNDEKLLEVAKYVQLLLSNFKVYTDFSGTSIGKRYVRADEIGVPFIITIDFDSLNDMSVTFRRSINGSQCRYQINDIVKNLSHLLK
jgi:glycyl-tRNA synthetase